jgi:hypothetical protein
MASEMVKAARAFGSDGAGAKAAVRQGASAC